MMEKAHKKPISLNTYQQQQFDFTTTNADAFKDFRVVQTGKHNASEERLRSSTGAAMEYASHSRTFNSKHNSKAHLFGATGGKGGVYSASA